MLNSVLTYYLDLVAFVLGAMLVVVVIDRWLRRTTDGSGFTIRQWMAVLVVLVAGVSLAKYSGGRERERLKSMTSGLAPTYAAELDRLGLASVDQSGSNVGRTYLRLIEAQKRWLEVNPSVADIYVMRQGDEGTIYFTVDSETDYDRNGQYDGDREQRTDLGEVFNTNDAVLASIHNAFSGKPVFNDVPTTDRWGTWVSSYQPVFGTDGSVYAVVGVDLDAQHWVESILMSRVTATLLSSILLVVVVATGLSTTRMRAEIERRRKVEASLKASESRLRTIVDNEPECVVVVDREGLLREINPAGLQMAEAVDASELIGRPFAALVHPSHRERLTSHHRNAVEGTAAITEFEFVGLRGHRQRLWLETHSVPLRDEQGNVFSVLSVARDVTARKNAQDERERLQRQLVETSRYAGMAEVASNVLHNVGNVLNSINISAGVVVNQLRNSKVTGLTRVAKLLDEHRADLPEFLHTSPQGKLLPDYLLKLSGVLESEHEEVLKELKTLLHGVEHVKEVVRMQQGHATCKVVVEPCVPADLFEQAVQLNLAAMTDTDLTIKRNFDSVDAVELDRHKVLQVLVNLISNAMKAVRHARPTGGEIVLRLSRDGESGQVQFDVIDNGMGISEPALAKLFQHGFTTFAGGHGFGLHSAANSAREMGGAVSACSDGEGQGARFCLSVPAPYASQGVAA